MCYFKKLILLIIIKSVLVGEVLSFRGQNKDQIIGQKSTIIFFSPSI